MSRASLFIPLSVFTVVATLLYVGFGLEDPHKLPSTLIGRPFPAFSLPSLHAPGELRDATLLRGRVHLVNVWATWCPTCKAEHAELLALTRTRGLAIVGVNYKDDAEKARDWLRRYGDPYVETVVDADGRLGIDLGVYGAPESFLVDAAGIVRLKIVGDINERVLADRLLPALAELGAGGQVADAAAGGADPAGGVATPRDAAAAAAAAVPAP